MPPRDSRDGRGGGDRRGRRSSDRSRRDSRSGGSSSARGGAKRQSSRREGGFGPHGPPRDPERERRPDVEPHASKPAPLRVKGERGTPSMRGSRRKQAPAQERRPRRRKRAPGDVESEITRLGGRRSEYYLRQLMQAADAYAHDRDREALRILRPLADAMPDSPSVHELMGLAQYRLGNYRAAGKQLDRFVEITDSVEQHPVLMDCARAQKRWRRVDELWEELAAASPAPELVTEGRIVAAGALADRGRIPDAIALLSKKAEAVKRPRADHLRLWYALADLEERAGNNARARALFDRVSAHDPEFADVATRRRSLGAA
jgi:tetratricopeptide (TPR) repeat protein